MCVLVHHTYAYLRKIMSQQFITDSLHFLYVSSFLMGKQKNQYKSDRHSTYNCWLDVEIRMEIALRSHMHTRIWTHTERESDIQHKRWQYQWFEHRMGLVFIHFIRYFLMRLKRIQIVCDISRQWLQFIHIHLRMYVIATMAIISRE